MKKIYIKPVTRTVVMRTERMCQDSIKVNSVHITSSTDGFEKAANERGGNIITVGEGYNRSLW